MRLLWALAAGLAAGPAAACRLALALALDVSGSVDEAEYRQQLDGLAAALVSPAVAAALLAEPERPVALAAFEWAGLTYRRDLVGWTLLADRAALDGAAAALRATRRRAAPATTGMGAALVYGAELMGQAPACARRVIDLSADGENNGWPGLREIDRALAGITVNGLVVGTNEPRATARLADWFRAEVIRGPGAFVEIARDYAGYAAAMERKLLRETEAPAIGALPRPAVPARRSPPLPDPKAPEVKS